MCVYDVNGDGLNDVVTSLQAHVFGLAWFEQKRDAGGKISFVQHMISDNFATKNAGGVVFSQPHGSTSADMNGDRIPDFIVGKRFFSHNESYADPDPYGAAGALRLPHGSQQAGAGRRRSSCPSWCTTSPARDRRCSRWI